MQGAVHQQMRVMRCQRLALLLGLSRHHRGAQHQVGHHHRFLLVIKGQHIGGVVFFAVTLVQRTAFFFAHDAHRDFGVIRQRMANGADDRVAGQGGAVASCIGDVAKLQGQLELFQGHGFLLEIQSSVGKGLRRVVTPARMAALPCAS